MSGSLQLSLVSHTNVGKTTLARTLLGRDVGEVRDAPHVTESADAYEMLRTPQGDTLRLWDTPGFGDSVRLLRRMQQAGNPLGWFLSQVWDRWRDRPFWASQQALRHVAETTDVVLYLVSAAEEPAAAAYVASEMALLRWVGKPVIVLLNQLGVPRESALEQAEVQRWREHLAPFEFVTQVLSLDAFARCWVQEQVLLQAIEASLQGEPRALMQRLVAVWRVQRLAVYDASVDALAQSMARLARAREELPERGGLRVGLRKLGAALGLAADERNPALLAQAALAQALDSEVRDNTTRLLELHGLAGQAQGEILQRIDDLAQRFDCVDRDAVDPRIRAGARAAHGLRLAVGAHVEAAALGDATLLGDDHLAHRGLAGPAVVDTPARVRRHAGVDPPAALLRRRGSAADLAGRGGRRGLGRLGGHRL